MKLNWTSVSRVPARTEPPATTWWACMPVSVWLALMVPAVPLMLMSVLVNPVTMERCASTW